MANTALNRSVVLLLTNKSGGAVAQGDVVIMDTTTAASFTTTTTGALTTRMIGVVLEPNGIANDAVGLVAFGGYVPKISLSGSASLGDFVKTHTVAKQGVRHASPIVAGDFAQVLGTGTSPAASLWGYPDQGAASSSQEVGDYGASSTITGYSSTTTTRISYIKIGRLVNVVSLSISGTSNATTLSFTLPYAVSASNGHSYPIYVTDNGIPQASPGRLRLNGGSATVNADKALNANDGWTASGAKTIQAMFGYITD